MEIMSIQPSYERTIEWNGLDLSCETVMENIAYLNSLSNQPKKSLVALNNQKLPQNFSKSPTKPWMLIAFLLLTFLAWFEISRIIEKKNNLRSVEIGECLRQYTVNRCNPMDRVPITAEKCLEWEKCINQDQESVSLVGALVELFSEVIGIFIGSLNEKSLAIVVGMPLVITWILVKYKTG